MSDVTAFQKRVERKSKKPLLIKVNNNTSTMLSVRWNRKETRLSIHKMFLKAPPNIMDDLACYILKEEDSLTPPLKAFIEQGVKKMVVPVHADEIISQGRIYNLKRLYNKINRLYFNDKLKLHITWYGLNRRRTASRITLGLYCSQRRLVKIHRCLDSPRIPQYVLEYVIFHEMLHHACPPYVDERGIRRIHNPRFKQREKLFPYYEEAILWIRKNQHLF
ncbi:MAG: M48 family metallopeptidase [Chlamydiia bacterium]|nr:M48 family metallopeptidase [Chlamydiia bacterium]